MVDIRSIEGSALPTQQGTEQEATSHSRVGRSKRNERPRRQHNRGGYCSCHTSVALNRYSGHAITRCWPRGHIGGGTPAPPQSSKLTCFAISSGVVVPQHQPAHRRCYQHQHTAPWRGGAGEPPWKGIKAISGSLTLTDGTLVPTVGHVRVVSARSKSRYGGFVGQARAPSLGRGRQRHHQAPVGQVPLPGS
jgi:hypothetical protein